MDSKSRLEMNERAKLNVIRIFESSHYHYLPIREEILSVPDNEKIRFWFGLNRGWIGIACLLIPAFAFRSATILYGFMFCTIFFTGWWCVRWNKYLNNK